jgi:hypothetical protein
MASRATYSADGEKWIQTKPGKRVDETMTYVLTPTTASVLVAWGPPYTPTMATKFVTDVSA